MRSSRKHAFYDDLVFQIFEEVYEPAEDSFLAAHSLVTLVEEGDNLLEIGTGCGILAIIAARKVSKVIATDVNPYAVRCAKTNARINLVDSKIEVRRGNMFQPVSNIEKFDIIVFNAPYLPTPQHEQRSWIGRSWSGGPSGRQLIDQFIKEAPNYLKGKSKILLVQSSLADITESLRKFQERRFEAKIIGEKKVPFETIVVIQASHLS